MSLIFQTYFKSQETKHSQTESLKLQNSPILKYVKNSTLFGAIFLPAELVKFVIFFVTLYVSPVYFK